MKKNYALLLILALSSSALCSCMGEVESVHSTNYLLDKAVWNWEETDSGLAASLKVPTTPESYTHFQTTVSKEELVPATCIDSGITRYIASATVNGILIKSHKDVLENPKGHKYTSYVVDGQKHSLHCECGYTEESEDHVFGDEIIIENANSYKSPGYAKRTCSICGYEKIYPLTNNDVYFNKKVEELNNQLSKFLSLPDASNIYQHLGNIENTNTLFDLFSSDEINNLPSEIKNKFLSIISCYGNVIDCSTNSPFNISKNVDTESNLSFEIKPNQYNNEYGYYSDIRLFSNWKNYDVAPATQAEIDKASSEYNKAALRIRTVDPTYEANGKTRYTFFTMPTNLQFSDFIKEIGFAIYAPIDGTRLAFQSILNNKMSSATRSYLTINPQSFTDAADVGNKTINGKPVGANNVSYKTSFIKLNSNKYEVRLNDDNNNPLFGTSNFYDAVVLMDNLAKASTQEIKLNKGWNKIVLDKNALKQLIDKDIFRILLELRNDNSIPKTVGDETWKITSFYNVNNSIENVLEDIACLPDFADLRFYHYTTIESIVKSLDTLPSKCKNVIDPNDSIKKLLEEAKKIVVMPYGHGYDLTINWNNQNTYTPNIKTEYGYVYDIHLGAANTSYTVQHKINSDIILCPNQTLCIYTKNYKSNYCPCFVINSSLDDAFQLKQVPLNDDWTAFYVPLNKIDFLMKNFFNNEHCLQFGFDSKGISNNNFLMSGINSVNIIPSDIDDQMNKLPDQLPDSLSESQIKILKGANFLYDAVIQKSSVKSALKLQDYNLKFNIEW